MLGFIIDELLLRPTLSNDLKTLHADGIIRPVTGGPMGKLAEAVEGHL